MLLPHPNPFSTLPCASEPESASCLPPASTWVWTIWRNVRRCLSVRGQRLQEFSSWGQGEASKEPGVWNLGRNSLSDANYIHPPRFWFQVCTPQQVALQADCPRWFQRSLKSQGTGRPQGQQPFTNVANLCLTWPLINSLTGSHLLRLDSLLRRDHVWLKWHFRVLSQFINVICIWVQI